MFLNMFRVLFPWGEGQMDMLGAVVHVGMGECVSIYENCLINCTYSFHAFFFRYDKFQNNRKNTYMAN